MLDGHFRLCKTQTIKAFQISDERLELPQTLLQNVNLNIPSAVISNEYKLFRLSCHLADVSDLEV